MSFRGRLRPSHIARCPSPPFDELPWPFTAFSHREMLDLASGQYRLTYKLDPALLSLGRRPKRPTLADATFLSWPLLSAAAAERLLAYLEPAPLKAVTALSTGAVGCGDLEGCGLVPERVRAATGELLACSDPAQARRRQHSQRPRVSRCVPVANRADTHALHAPPLT